MRKFKKIMLVVIAIVILFLVYLITNFYIIRQSWKYKEGAHVGDWIEFNKGNLQLKDRKIYKNGEQIGSIKFCLGKLLIIASSKTGESGYYINKGN